MTRDKLEMRRVLERAAPHLNPPFAAGDDAEAVARLFGGGAPVVAKPVAGTGSNAVALLRSADDLPEDRRNRATLLERYVGDGSSASRRCPPAGATPSSASRRSAPRARRSSRSPI